MADAEVHDLLTAWCLTEYIDTFKDNRIDIRAIQHLTEDMMKELVPIVGDRAKFKANLDSWKSLIVGNSLREQQQESPKNSQPCYFDFDDHQVDASSSNNEINREEQAARGSVQLDSPQPENYDHKKNTSLYKLLQESSEGKLLLHSFGETGLLSSSARSKLCNLIVRHELCEDASRQIPAALMVHWAHEISIVFSKESSTTYYIPYLGYSPGVRRLASGKLQDCYHNRKRDFRKAGFIGLHRINSGSSQSSTSTDVFPEGLRNVDVDEVQESQFRDNLEWLHNSSDPWELVERNWEVTAHLRLKNLFQNRSDNTVASYTNKYPALKKPTGYILLQKDFEVLYPGTGQRLHENLPLHKVSILEQVRNKYEHVKDTTTKTILGEYLEVAEVSEEASNAATLLSLPFLLATKTSRQKKAKTTWRPSKVEVRDGFITHVRSAAELEETITRRKDKLSRLGITFQPLVIIVGPTLAEIRSFYVVIDSVFYKLHNIVAAVDCCFKSFHALCACYPTESANVWHLIQRGFYNFSTPWDRSFSGVSAFMSDVGIKH